MNLDKYTQKTLEALKAAQALALDRGSMEIRPEHVCYALVTQDGGLIGSLFGKMGIDVPGFTASLEDELSRIPGVKLYTARPEEPTHVPVISFNIMGHDSEEVAALLDSRFAVAVRAGLHCAPLAHKAYGTEQNGTVRAVLSVYTNPAQIDHLIMSVRKIQKLLSKKVAIGNKNVLE